MKRYGITDPISTKSATSQDIELSDQLLDVLTRSNFFELEDESTKRELVLGDINSLVREFVKRVAVEQGMPESYEPGGKIFTFGSYRLGVHSRGADIDTLCIVPNHVSRTDFFSTFYDMLAHVPQVTELCQVPDAHVPLIKFYYENIPIDLLFCSVPLLSTIPHGLDNLLDTGLLKNMDEKCVLSINGSRTTDEIIRLIPCISTFRLALRCIKLWAKRRGLYSNAMGYLGGVACAIMVARICQLYPNAAASVIVSRFFSIYLTWNWPQPVMLRRIEYGVLNMKVWNPRTNMADKNHRMPVITPAFPSMCSTHNVGESTMRVILHELKRAARLVGAIDQRTIPWDDLFIPTDYFHRCKQFLQISTISADPTDAQQWSSYIESRLRMLVLKLEQVLCITCAPPFPNVFDLQLRAPSSKHVFDSLMHAENDSEYSSPDTTTLFYTSVFYIALDIHFTGDPHESRRVNLAGPVSEFKKLVLSWDRIQPSMQLHIRELKRAALPDHVFGNNSRPPKKAKNTN